MFWRFHVSVHLNFLYHIGIAIVNISIVVFSLPISSVYLKQNLVLILLLVS